MIFGDLAALDGAGFRPAVCIVGSEPAGLSLALQLERHRIPCLVLEAGGFAYDADTQDACGGEVVGDRYAELAATRLRVFGGGSGHWEGWCRALDAIDFEPRAGIEAGGWPIRRRDLAPFAARADDILDLPPPARPDRPVNEDLQEIGLRVSRPVTRLGTKYRRQVEDSPSIGLLLDSPVTDLVPERGRIAAARIGAEGQGGEVRAPFFAVCAGGIENSRLLLWANRLHDGGVVPRPATLGRYWMEHPRVDVGDVIVFDFTRMRAAGGMRFYAPSEAWLRGRPATGNFGMRLQVGEGLPRALLRDAMCVAPELFRKVAKDGLACSARARLAWEQVPLAANRVELGRARDRLGMPRTVLHWRKSPQDRRTAEVASVLFGNGVAASELGRMKILPWITEGGPWPDEHPVAGFHHMGGTRMADGPARGVVDRDCKVFGVDNLYVGGASVFPTGGHAPPTYAIVQLALRLGDHLAGRLAKE